MSENRALTAEEEPEGESVPVRIVVGTILPPIGLDRLEVVRGKLTDDCFVCFTDMRTKHFEAHRRGKSEIRLTRRGAEADYETTYHDEKTYDPTVMELTLPEGYEIMEAWCDKYHLMVACWRPWPDFLKRYRFRSRSLCQRKPSRGVGMQC